MKIPKNFNTGSHVYRVKLVKTRDDAKERHNLGKTTHENHLIYIEKDLSASRLEETFLHELLHICFYQAALQNKFRDDEEYIVDALTNQLYGILVKNKMLK